MSDEKLPGADRRALPAAGGRTPPRLDKRGSVSLLIAAAVPPMLVAGIFAIDAARNWIAEARLQSALDAAALTAARDFAHPDRDKNVQAVLAANYNGGAPAQPDGAADPGAWQNVTITQPNPGQVQVQASVNVNPLLNGLTIGGVRVWPQPAATITRAATANRTGTGIELALVFDVTGSMLVNDGTVMADGTRPTRIVAARDAALKLTDVLYGGAATVKRDGEDVTTQENLYISVVPYNIAVNIGPEYTNFLSSTGAPTYSHGHTWAGCVEARRNGFDLREDSPNPANPDSMFRRYFWASTYNSAQTSINNASCLNTQDYDSNRACQGHNDWTAPADLQSRNHLIRAWGSRGAKFGPNFMCPTVPVLPLTMRKEAVQSHINSLVGTAERPYAFSSGTALPSGLQAAWYTLSPDWRGVWRNHDHAATRRPALPLPYNTENMAKVMVLLSDGDNNWGSARSALSASRLVRPENRRTELFYNTYGNLASNRLRISIPGVTATSGGGGDDDDDGDDDCDDDDGGGCNQPTRTEAQLAADYRTVRPRADAALDNATLQTCAKIKAAGITLYAVGLGVAEYAHRRLMEDCVSTPTADDLKRGIKSYYIHTDNLGELVGAFTHIANQLTNLRLTK